MQPVITTKPKLGKKNILTKREFIPVIEQTVEEIITLLKQSCGRNSRYGLVISPETNQFMDIGSVTATSNKLNIFSKDGAHLTQSLQYGNSLQSYIQNLLVYIGDRVDSACGDGTTTSMMFAGQFLIEALKIPEIFPEWKTYSTSEIISSFDNVVSDILSRLENSKITIQSLQQEFSISEEVAIWIMSYIQAYTSSNGDQEIASAIATAFSQVPAECIDEMYQVYPEMEREQKIEVVIDEAQYIVEDPVFVTTELMNHNFMKEYLAEDAILICLPQGIPDAGPLTTELLKYLTALDAQQDVVIVAPKIGNSFIGQIVKEKNEGRRIALIVHGKNGGRFSTLPLMSLALCGLMNTPIYGVTEDIKIDQLNQCIREHIKIHFTGKQVKLYNLYEPMEGFKGHPGIKDSKDYPFYTRIREELHETKDRVIGHHKKQKQEMEDIHEALAALEHTKRIKIIGGGRTYDQLAIRLVIEDCIAANLSAIRHGIHFNGPLRLMFAIKEALQQPTYMTSRNVAINGYLLSAMYEAIKLVVKQLFNSFNLDSMQYIHPLSYLDSNAMIDANLPMNSHVVTPIEPCSLLNVVLNEYYQSNMCALQYVPPSQPSKMFSEMFVRIKEVVLKTVLSNAIITIGEVFDMETS